MEDWFISLLGKIALISFIEVYQMDVNPPDSSFRSSWTSSFIYDQQKHVKPAGIRRVRDNLIYVLSQELSLSLI